MATGVLTAYREWAATYDEMPNPVLALERRILKHMLRSLPGKIVLDAGCGTGRWMGIMKQLGVTVWGADLSESMLARASRKGDLSRRCVRADISALPFADNSFDAVLCSFVLSYTLDIRVTLAELARVAREVIVTDLHPEAMRRGWNRSCGSPHQVQYSPYTISELERAADFAGLRMAARIDAGFGEPERKIFCEAGREAQFERVSECPAVLIMKWKR